MEVTMEGILRIARRIAIWTVVTTAIVVLVALIATVVIMGLSEDGGQGGSSQDPESERGVAVAVNWGAECALAPRLLRAGTGN